MNKMDAGFYFHSRGPSGNLADYVERIGVFGNPAAVPHEVVVLPDGRIDLFFWQNESGTFDVLLLGLETEAEQRMVPPGTLVYTISFTPLGVEYLLGRPIAAILNSGMRLEDGFWGFAAANFSNLDTFYAKAITTLEEKLVTPADPRKLKLFRLIYAADGEIGIAALAAQVGWGSRQINRYFSQYFGLPLKTYCNILRFRASLHGLAKGKLFPELDFADQNHFIKQVKKFSGVVPKELSKNKNDRFVLLSLLKGQ